MENFDLQTKCPVCGDLFKTPRMAPTCGHSFCTSCMKLMICDSTHGEGFECVVCKTFNKVAAHDVDSLPINVDLRNALHEISTKLLAAGCKAHPQSMKLAYCKECDVVICKDECALNHPQHTVENLVAAMTRMKSVFEATTNKLSLAIKDLRLRLADHKRRIKQDLERNIASAKQRIVKEVEALHKLVENMKIELSETVEMDLRCSAQRSMSLCDLVVSDHAAKAEMAIGRTNTWLRSDESLGCLIEERNLLLQLCVETESFAIPLWQPKVNV